MSTHLKNVYQRDIDGLRAIAVTAVVLYHTGLSLFSGGYVGVDVFFVISGYLITGIIHREIIEEKFTFKQFWLRRARRILPASSAMVFITIITFAFIYPVNLYENFLKSVISNQVFASNILFWSEGGYFDNAQELKPLLHTWSLAIEEQFYVFFPLLLLFIDRVNRRLLAPILVSVSTLSLLLSIYAANNYSEAGFYLLPSRVWEFGFGALIAIYGRHLILTQSYAFLCQIIGLLFVAVPIFIFDESTPFPSFYALLPVIGTGILILTNKTKTLIISIIGSKPLVYIGLISYSVYLWHWPIIVLNNWLFLDENSATHTAIIIFMSYLLGYISYKFVELPTRNKIKLSDNRLVIGLAVSSLVIVISSIYLLYKSNAFLVDPQNIYTPQYNSAIEPEKSREKCTDLFLKGKSDLCRLGPFKRENIDLFIWGDSHAGSMMPAFYQLSKEHDLNIEFSITLGCQAILNMNRVDVNHSCDIVNARVINQIAKQKPDSVILISSFVNNITKGKLRDVNRNKTDKKDLFAEFSTRFNETVDTIKQLGINVIVMTEPPRFKTNPIFSTLRANTLNVKAVIPALNKKEHYQRIDKLYAIVDASNINERLDYTSLFCPEFECLFIKNNHFLYQDGNHLSQHGSKLVAPYFYNDIKKYLNNKVEN
jgi:peptidoglycan/LPS O-acetylase OafA/YrhL/lysophospholipase L1-like esterase